MATRYRKTIKAAVATEKESDVQNAICEYLELKRRCFFRLNNIPAFNREGGGIVMRRLPKFTPKGLPDIIVIAGGLFFGLEVKTKIGTQSKEQKEFERWVKEHGGRYHVVRSIDEVKAIGL
jgi:hypothetical protein